MKTAFAMVVLCVSGFVMAKIVVSKIPAKQASTTTAPATTSATHFPTPSELLEKMKALRKQEEATPKVAYFDLSDPIVEKPASFSFFGQADATTLRSLLDRMHQAAKDSSVRAVLVTLGTADLHLAQAQEIRDALRQISKAGKETFVYADSYDSAGYTIASGASHICMLEGGEIMMPGVGMETMFAKGLLDKVGVKADYIQIGEYKGADEQYTRTGASDELRGELSRLTDSLYEQIVDGISLNRNLPKEKVRRMIDDALLTGAAAKNRGFIDHLVDQDGLRELIENEIGETKVEVVHDYGRPQRETPDLSNPFGFFAMLSRRPEVSDKPQIALIYVDGVIVDGQGGEGMFGGSSIGSDEMRQAFRIAARDENIKAVVLRIDSPGGSALASEVMWQAARHVAEKKPLIVSVGSMAASGGYYLASAGETIYADPAGIVGSIGVVGGKFVTKDLFDKLGVNTESFNKGRNADLFSSNQPFTDRQRRMVTTWMRHTYDQFTERVMSTRGKKIKDIDEVARGRIFLAKQAKSLGMVDEIGGINDALACAAKKSKLAPSSYDVRVLPSPRTLADFFGGSDRETKFPIQPKITISPDSVLRALGPSVRRMLGQQLQTIELLQQHPVILVAPFVVDVE